MNSSFTKLAATTAVVIPYLLKRNFASNQKKMVLHLYDHCPFCIRVELVLGWNNIKYERNLYGYGDIEGPTKIIGKKMLPVLEYYDEKGKKQYLGESLDIIKLLTKNNPGQYKDFSGRKDLKEWKKEKYKPLERILLRPRVLEIGLYDFESEADKAYAMNKYQKQGFDYDVARQKSSESIKQMEKVLQEFASLLKGPHAINAGKDYDYDDINYLPMLRNLTCVKGLKWPAKVRAYVDAGTEKAEVAQYRLRAV